MIFGIFLGRHAPFILIATVLYLSYGMFIIIFYNFSEEDPVDNKKVSRTKKAATKTFCLQKPREQHEERRAQPPGPPKPVSC